MTEMRPARLARLVMVTALIGVVVGTGGVPPSAAHATSTFDIVGPAGSGAFGETVLVLSNGNFVVTDPGFDIPGAADAGAVRLYDGATNAVISTLTGSFGGDRVGSHGIVEVGDSNFVAVSSFWSNVSTFAGNAGAVTWINGSTGLDGTVTSMNSIVGTTGLDAVGHSGVQRLTNGNYVVRSYHWHNDAKVDAGAVTWGSGSGGTFGALSPANSIVGGSDTDEVGRYDVVTLANGNYVVPVPSWDNGLNGNLGAVRWGNGSSGTSGLLSGANSLVGTTVNDTVGSSGVVALTNGNYVVASLQWDRTGVAVNAGAATWGNGNGGTFGSLNAGNSLVGSAANDTIGLNGVTALTNGNYVVSSSGWDGGSPNRGAVTWGNGTGSTFGEVTAANSLTGPANASVGSGGAFALTNGHYVASSPFWEGDSTNVGAATWRDGTSASPAVVSAANSLIGAAAEDRASSGGIAALSNGNYVVSSVEWRNGAATNAGAATWASGSGPTAAVISTTNSVVGSQQNDRVGQSGIVPLTNGNAVVGSYLWSDGDETEVGAATWMNGSAPSAMAVGATNSLIGSTTLDHVGLFGLAPLANGNYVVTSSVWNSPLGTPDVGAVTWGDGTTGTKGHISESNSLVGTTSSDRVGSGGSGVVRYPNSSYVVHSKSWDNSPIVDAGAATFGGLTGVSGTVTAGKGLLGTVPGDITMVAKDFTSGGKIVIGRATINTVTLLTTDVTPPILAQPPDLTVVATAGASGAAVSYSVMATDDVGTPAVACSPAAGTEFPIGATTVSCTATNTEGLTASTSFTVMVTAGTDYVPLVPTRLADTRPGFATADGLFAGEGVRQGGSTLELTVAGRGGVAGTSVAAALNVTVTETTSPGFLTAYPCGSPQPTASNLNYDVGTTVPNALIAKIGVDGKVCVFVSQTLHLVVDVNGAFPAETSYRALNPARLLDTRDAQPTVDGVQQATGAVGAGSTIFLQITGRAGVPADASAVVLNVTITEPTAPGFATVYPCGESRPTASNLNYTAGLTTPNLVIAKVGAGGNVCIYTQSPTHLVADVNGFFPEVTTYEAINPSRLLDTRPGESTIDGDGAGAGVQPAGTVTVVRVAGRGGVPTGATTAVLNLTVTEAAAAGYVTVYPCGVEPPLASNLNYVTGQTIPNAVLSKIAPDGTVCIFNSQALHLITDVEGYFP